MNLGAVWGNLTKAERHLLHNVCINYSFKLPKNSGFAKNNSYERLIFLNILDVVKALEYYRSVHFYHDKNGKITDLMRKVKGHES